MPPPPPRPPRPPKGPRKPARPRAAAPADGGATGKRGSRAAAWRAAKGEAPARGRPAGAAEGRAEVPPATGGRRDRQRAPRERARPAAEPREPRHVEGPPQRLAKLLARAGVASRREVERMIEEGRIAVGGVAVDKAATILTSLAGVTVDGRPVNAPAPARLFLFHKPPGVLTAERDFSGRPTIYDRLPRTLPRVIPVGRLDLNTEGLLLLTTDGELKRQLELPSSKVDRTYRARVFGEISQERLESLITGIEIEGVRYGSIDANLERRTGRNAWLEMRLTEGKNREVRRVLEYLGLQVSRLIRVAYGPFVLADLPVGGVDEVRPHDLDFFRKALRTLPARGGPKP